MVTENAFDGLTQDVVISCFLHHLLEFIKAIEKAGMKIENDRVNN